MASYQGGVLNTPGRTRSKEPSTGGNFFTKAKTNIMGIDAPQFSRLGRYPGPCGAGAQAEPIKIGATAPPG